MTAMPFQLRLTNLHALVDVGPLGTDALIVPTVEPAILEQGEAEQLRDWLNDYIEAGGR